MSYIKSFQEFVEKKEGKELAIASDDTAQRFELNTGEDDEDYGFPDDVVPVYVQTISDPAPGMDQQMEHQIEHSYTLDSSIVSHDPAIFGPERAAGLPPTRTVLLKSTPHGGSSHSYGMEDNEMDDGGEVPIPTYDEIKAKEAMNECARIAKYVKNINPDDEDWESRVNQFGWTNVQKSIFSKAARVLDNDQLGRLALVGRPGEPVQRRAVVDESAASWRRILASISWDSRLTQWLHFLLMDILPPSYMASYLDILQTLKSKLPSLIDKMLFSRPVNISQELLAPVMKKKWEPVVHVKVRKLSHQAIILVIPNIPLEGPVPRRLQSWYQQFATVAQVVQVALPTTNKNVYSQPLEVSAEQVVCVARVKIHELRSENPSRAIILIGFNAGAALALQVALSENITCVICMGFAYNTLNGVRGTPDDRILDIKVPILFVIGQRSAKTSQEEMECLREKLQSESSLVVVGSADDYLRVPKNRRLLEGVSQTMVDTMIMDEVFAFVKRILHKPPGPRMPTQLPNVIYANTKMSGGGSTVKGIASSHLSSATPLAPVEHKTPGRKRKNEANAMDGAESPAKAKFQTHIGRPRKNPPPGVSVSPTKQAQIITSTPIGKNVQLPPDSDNELSLTIQSILGEDHQDQSSLNASMDSTALDGAAGGGGGAGTGGSGVVITGNQKLVTNFELVPQSKSTLINSKATNISGTTGVNPASLGAGVAATKIKMVPSNQFVQLKPAIQSQSKMFTINTPIQQQQPQILSSAQIQVQGGTKSTTTTTTAGSGQQHVFTLKSPNGKTTQFVTALPSGTTQPKYTVVRNASGNITSLQLAGLGAGASGAQVRAGGGQPGSSSNMDLSNIIDMPIVFADNEGNLTDTVTTTVASTEVATPPARTTLSKPSTSGVGQLIISQQLIKEANKANPAVSSAASGSITVNKGTYIIGKPSTAVHTAATGLRTSHAIGTSPGGGKVVYINRQTMKPVTSIVQKTPTTGVTTTALPIQKYTKLLLTNPQKSTTTTVQAAAVTIGPRQAGTSSGLIGVSGVKQINLQALKSQVTLGAGGAGVPTVATGSIIRTTQPSGGTFSVGNKTFQILSTPQTTVNVATGSTAASGNSQAIRNIVLKTGSGLKQIPEHLKTQLLNRNLTVRKLVNFVPTSANTTLVGGGASVTIAPKVLESATRVEPSESLAHEVAEVVSTPSSSSTLTASSSLQSAPKVLTLNPINPITQASGP